MARGVDEDGELKPPDGSLGSHFWQRSTSWLGQFSVRRALSRFLFRRKDEGGEGGGGGGEERGAGESVFDSPLQYAIARLAELQARLDGDDAAMVASVLEQVSELVYTQSPLHPPSLLNRLPPDRLPPNPPPARAPYTSPYPPTPYPTPLPTQPYPTVPTIVPTLPNPPYLSPPPLAPQPEPPPFPTIESALLPSYVHLP